MPTYLSRKRRGRAPRAEMDVLRTQIWFRAVSLRTGWSAYRLEKHFHPAAIRYVDGRIVRPRRWDRYRNGTMVPKDIPGKRGLIDVVNSDARARGTARWFRSPLWRALRPEPMTSAEVEQGLRTLERKVVRLLLARERKRYGNVLKPKPFDDQVAASLIAVGSFDALAAAILLVRLSEAIASAELRELALRVYSALRPSIASLPEVAPFYSRLFRLIDVRCKHWIYVAPNRRLETVIFSEAFEDIWRGQAEERQISKVRRKLLPRTLGRRS